MKSNGNGRSTGWAVPSVALLGGVAMFAAASVGGQPALGAGMFAIMAAYAALLLAAGRSEVVKVLRGQPSDERYRSFDLRATAFAGSVVILAVIGGFLFELARGGDPQPYSLLAAVGGVSYLMALLWLRWRS